MSRADASPAWTLDPPPGEWPALLRRTPLDDAARALRAELGLPTDRPVVMTGHQPEFWHPGILAKYIAADALAGAADAHAAHLVVDSDETDPGAVRIPVTGDTLAVRTLRLLPQPGAGVPACAAPGARPVAADPADTIEPVRNGLRSIIRTLEAHASASSLGEQLGRSISELLQPWAPLPAPLYSSRLAATSAFRAIVDRMASDPRACIEAHNAAVEQIPEARIAPLVSSADRLELPLWRIRPGQARARVFAKDLPGIPAGELAPRALLLTGFLRLFACDLFIHGAGGAVYDRITDRWLESWLGRAPAPAVRATATLRLPLSTRGVPAVADIDRAAWTAHHARHDPSLVGDTAGAAQKARLLAAVRSARVAGADALPPFRALQDFLADHRARHADALAQLHAQADALRARRDEAAIAADRTWAFPLYPAELLDALASDIRGAFA